MDKLIELLIQLEEVKRSHDATQKARMASRSFESWDLRKQEDVLWSQYKDIKKEIDKGRDDLKLATIHMIFRASTGKVMFAHIFPSDLLVYEADIVAL